jgi:hypothetical protein
MIRTGTERLPNNSIQWTTLRAAADLGRLGLSRQQHVELYLFFREELLGLCD